MFQLKFICCRRNDQTIKSYNKELKKVNKKQQNLKAKKYNIIYKMTSHSVMLT